MVMGYTIQQVYNLSQDGFPEITFEKKAHKKDNSYLVVTRKIFISKTLKLIYMYMQICFCISFDEKV